MKTCCFMGHRDTPEHIYPALLAAVERHIVEYGVTAFLVGNYGAFDRMAARAVGESRTQHPGVTLTLMLAYLPRPGQKLQLPDGVDSILYPEELKTVSSRGAIPCVNRVMAERSDYAIAYVVHSWGGASKTLEQAKKRMDLGKMEVLNLAETEHS